MAIPAETRPQIAATVVSASQSIAAPENTEKITR
jgi:hypothetical protein